MISKSMYWIRGRRWNSGTESEFLIYQPDSLRPVLFLFYTLETVFNMFCMGFHIEGFMTVDMETLHWDGQSLQYFYLVTFYIFMVWTPFQSIGICTGHRHNVCVEIWKSLAAAIAFIIISLTTMWDAERQFHLFFDTEVKEVSGKYNAPVPVHRFFYYMRGQSISSLACGLLYMLHATIMIDVKLTTDLNNGEHGGNHMPIPLFVMGGMVHRKLNSYEWFREFCENNTIDL
uniref:Uncharacterized protein LOC108038088 n=1 Tax=Drosophila rhopaloa TaxID=1041015 RepID=A0A6P4DXQ7_DRORH